MSRVRGQRACEKADLQLLRPSVEGMEPSGEALQGGGPGANTQGCYPPPTGTSHNRSQRGKGAPSCSSSQSILVTTRTDQQGRSEGGSTQKGRRPAERAGGRLGLQGEDAPPAWHRHLHSLHHHMCPPLSLRVCASPGAKTDDPQTYERV